MSKYQFVLAGKHFDSKSAVQKYIQDEIYYSYPVDVYFAPYHQQVLVDLLEYHPKRDEKIGSGVKRMWLQHVPHCSTAALMLERHDGSVTDFSYRKCLFGTNNLARFKQACRNAIEPFKRVAKFDFPPGQVRLCPILGIEMTCETSHIDHMPPNTFDKIVTGYIRDRNIDVNDPALLKSGIGASFASEEQAYDWICYHNERAKLRLISSQANLSGRK